MLETQLEAKFRGAVKKIGGQAMKFTSPGNAGVPDRLILLPGGSICFAELKRPGEKLRPLQAHVIKHLQSLGFQVYVIDSEQGIQDFIDACFRARPHAIYEKGYRKGYQDGTALSGGKTK